MTSLVEEDERGLKIGDETILPKPKGKGKDLCI